MKFRFVELINIISSLDVFSMVGPSSRNILSTESLLTMLFYFYILMAILHTGIDKQECVD